jgi:hypothetical protein
MSDGTASLIAVFDATVAALNPVACPERDEARHRLARMLPHPLYFSHVDGSPERLAGARRLFQEMRDRLANEAPPVLLLAPPQEQQADQVDQP